MRSHNQEGFVDTNEILWITGLSSDELYKNFNDAV